MRSPRRTPCARSQLATWFERAAISANERFFSLPSSSTIHSAGLRALSARIDVEIVERPVELVELAASGSRGRRRRSRSRRVQQEVARGAEALRCRARGFGRFSHLAPP